MPYLASDPYPLCDSVINNYNSTKFYDMKAFYESYQDVKCIKQCPTECEYVNYKTAISTSTFPTAAYIEALKYKKYLKLGDDLHKIRNAMLATNVFLNTDLYSLIDEKPAKPFEEWVAESGGTLGLFVGASLLSFIEFVDVLIECIIIVCVSRKKKVAVSQTDFLKH